MKNIGFISEYLTSIVASSAISLSISADELMTALITFGVSLVTLVGGELIKFLIKFFQAKAIRYEKEIEQAEKEKEEKNDG